MDRAERILCAQRPLAAMVTRLFQLLRERVPGLDASLKVHERVSAVGGGPLASAIAMAGFVSLFPLLLVGIAVVGWFSVNDVSLGEEIVDQLQLDGKAADAVLDAVDSAEATRRVATLVGFVGFIWSGLAVVGAVEGALNTVWQVRGRGITGKLRQLQWLVGAGILLSGSILVTSSLSVLPGPAGVSSWLLGLVIDMAMLLWTFHRLTNAPVPWRAHLAGAVLGGIGFGILKLVAGIWVPRLVSSSSALYGSIGVVFAILAWMALAARVVVYTAAFNVIRYEQGHGTVTVELEVPHIEGQVPLDATRGGAIASSASGPS